MSEYAGRPARDVHFAAHALKWLLAVCDEQGVTVPDPPTEQYQRDYPIGFRRQGDERPDWEHKLLHLYAWSMSVGCRCVVGVERDFIRRLTDRRWCDPWWQPQGEDLLRLNDTWLRCVTNINQPHGVFGMVLLAIEMTQGANGETTGP